MNESISQRPSNSGDRRPVLRIPSRQADAPSCAVSPSPTCSSPDRVSRREVPQGVGSQLLTPSPIRSVSERRENQKRQAQGPQIVYDSADRRPSQAAREAASPPVMYQRPSIYARMGGRAPPFHAQREQSDEIREPVTSSPRFSVPESPGGTRQLNSEIVNYPDLEGQLDGINHPLFQPFLQLQHDAHAQQRGSQSTEHTASTGLLYPGLPSPETKSQEQDVPSAPIGLITSALAHAADATSSDIFEDSLN